MSSRNILKESSTENIIRGESPTIAQPNEELKFEAHEDSKNNNQELELGGREFKQVSRKKNYQEERKRQIDVALEGLQKLLGISTIYSKFLEDRVTKKANRGGASRGSSRAQPKSVSSQSKAANTKDITDIDVANHLKYFEGGSLRPYQLEGVEWIMKLYVNSISGILGDEMGLGKTIQVIALICHLIERGVNKNPFLIIIPLSTLGNWRSEFERFAPKIPVVCYHAPSKTRPQLQPLINKSYKLEDGTTVKPVVIITYETTMRDFRFLFKFKWEYVIIDEGQRVKNHKSELARVLHDMPSNNRLILSGTPLQNTVTELWALFNFLMPEIFKDDKMFSDLLLLEDLRDTEQLLQREGESNIIGTIQKVLGPFMLRRLKKDVEKLPPKKEVNIYCPLSQLQKDLYSYTIEQDLAALRGQPKAEVEVEVDVNAPRPKRKCTMSLEERDAHLRAQQPRVNSKTFPSHADIYYRITMQNRLAMYRKIVNHPYLIHYPVIPGTHIVKIGEDLVANSGKMLILNTLLAKLKERGHKVLIFCGLVMMLDFVEDLFLLRDYKYRILNGTIASEKRQENIAQFNEDADVFGFLISTRAGGLGLNLVGADTIIFIDRDWNPQQDIQAMARCHRIGQTRPVVIYTLVSKNTIDETVLERGEVKRRLEKLVIREGTFKHAEKNRLKTELLEIKKLLEQESAVECVHSNGYFSEEEWNKLLDRSDLYKEMTSQDKEN